MSVFQWIPLVPKHTPVGNRNPSKPTDPPPRELSNLNFKIKTLNEYHIKMVNVK